MQKATAAVGAAVGAGVLATHRRGTVYRQMLPFIPFTPGLMSDCK